MLASSMRSSASLRSCCLLTLLATGAHAAGEVFFFDQDMVLASDPHQGAHFGVSLAVQGERAVIGAPRAVSVPGLVNGGAAYVLVRSGGAWVEEAKLVAPDATNSAEFGAAVALDGDRILVGANGDDVDGKSNAGSAYVFVRNGSDWTFEAKLLDPDGDAGDTFGGAVALAGDTALVGAPWDDYLGGLGSASVFERGGATWSHQAKFHGLDTGSGDLFGTSLCLAGDTALIGAPANDPAPGVINAGAAYVFERSGATWSQSAKLVASDAFKGDSLGRAVCFAGGTALVGADSVDLTAEFSNEGAVYVFEGAGSAWSETDKWTASDAAPQGRFGQALALSGDLALVGSNQSPWSGTSEGTAYAFQRATGAWAEVEVLNSPDGAPGDFFASSVALDGPYAFVGAYSDTHSALSDAGSAYPYDVLTCPAVVPPVEVARVGAPPNPGPLLPGVSGPPRIGHSWEPKVDNLAFMHAPLGNWLVVGVAPANLPTGFGTVLCDLTQPYFVVSSESGDPFVLPIPAECMLAGVALSAQAAALDFAMVGLTNALDIVIGTP